MSVCALSADGSRLALVEDGRVRVVATDSGVTLCVCVEPRHLAVRYTCAAWCGTTHVALGTAGGAVVAWDVARATLALEGRVPGGGAVVGVAALGATRVAAAGPGGLSLWELGHSAPVASWGSGLGPVAARSGSQVVVGAGAGVALHDALSGAPERAWSGAHAAAVVLLACGGGAVVTGAGDRLLCVWLDGADAPAATLGAPAALGATAASAEGRVLAVAADGSAVYLWPPVAGGAARKRAAAVAPEHSLECGNHPCLAAHWLDDGAVLVARLHSGRPVFARVPAGGALPPLGSGAAASTRTGLDTTPRAQVKSLAGLSGPPALPGRGYEAGPAKASAAGGAVTALQQALRSGDAQLLDEVLRSGAADATVDGLDPLLAAPLLAALTARLARDAGDTGALSWINALLRRHRATLQADRAGTQSSLESLRALADQRSASLKRLLRLRGKLELLGGAATRTGSGPEALPQWREGAGPMLVSSDDDGDLDDDGEDADSGDAESGSEDEQYE